MSKQTPTERYMTCAPSNYRASRGADSLLSPPYSYNNGLITAAMCSEVCSCRIYHSKHTVVPWRRMFSLKNHLFVKFFIFWSIRFDILRNHEQVLQVINNVSFSSFMFWSTFMCFIITTFFGIHDRQPFTLNIYK